MNLTPLAYFITFTTYGTWLHGRAPGSVGRKHNVPGTPFLPPNADLKREMHSAMRQEPYVLDEPRRQVVLRIIKEVAAHRQWKLWAVHVRPNHVLVACTPANVVELIFCRIPPMYVPSVSRTNSSP
jgi:hypothetical protein